MKKILFAASIVTGLYSLAPAQLVRIIFGPRDGDSAGILYAYNDARIEVDVWIRTEPGVNIVSLFLPLSTKDDYILSDSRAGGDLLYPIDPELGLWDDALFLPPNEDSLSDGYMNQTLLALKDLVGNPDPDNGIQTEGEWWRIASFLMSATGENSLDEPLCDALIEGAYEDPIFHDIYQTTLSEFSLGELNPSQYELEFACLQFQPSCGDYVIGDFNGSGAFNLADVVDGYSMLKTGSPEPAVTCECPAESGNEWAVAMDVNNSCTFNVADIVDSYSKLKTGLPELVPCIYCPPPGWEP